MDLHIKNEWLAKLLMNQYHLITEYWIEDIRAEHITSYDPITDEQLRRELPPTVDSMIYALRTGDLEGPRKHAFAVMRKRLEQGFRLPALQMSLHALQTAVMRIVQKAGASPLKNFEAMWSASDMYYTVALIAAEVYEQLRAEQQRRFTSAYELGIELNRTLELSTVLDTAVCRVAEHANVDSVAILLARPGTHRDEVRAYYNLDTKLEKILPDLSESLTYDTDDYDVLNVREATRIVSDVRNSNRLGRWADILVSHGYLGLMCIPLVAKRNRLGNLIVFRSEASAISDLEVDFLSAMAGHIANALQNAILYEEAQGKRELAMLLDASKVFASSLDISDILNKIVKMATEALKADLVVAYIPSFLRDGLHNIAYYSKSRKARYAIRHIEEIIALGGEDSCYHGLMNYFTSEPSILFGSYDESPKWLRPLIGVVSSGMVIPLKHKGMLLGAFTLISLEKNAFSENDLSLATALADLAAVAIENARLYEYERKIAETLQRSFLPVDLPCIEGYEIAAYYRPAMVEAEIGGDFYDVFPIGDGRLSIIIADVSGKGLQAAVLTAMGKYMIRAYAVENPSPGDVLTRFNKAFYEYRPEDMFLTVFYGILDPKDNVFTYASAGHNPPLLYSSASDQVTEIEVAGISVGIFPDAKYEEMSLQLQPEDALLLYTDGATDVKENGDRLEVEGLQQLFQSSVHASAAQAVGSVFNDISEYGHGKLPDDVALILLKKLS